MADDSMIHIVDDDAAIRNSLSMLMLSEGMQAQTYDSAEDFLSKYEPTNSSCLLLDMRMPGMSGLTLLSELKKKNISIPTIFLTGHGDVAMAVKAMKEGATDFIEKPFDTEYLLRRTRDCLIESVCLEEDNKRKHVMFEKLSRLTKREKQVMGLLVEGKQNKTIAYELNISVRTVEIHRAKVMEKLNAHSLSEIVRIFLLAQ